MELDLPVLWYTDEQMAMASVDADKIDLNECIVKQHTFYIISHIRPYDKDYCDVISDGIRYIVKMKYENVKQLIRDQMVFKFN